ncbi:RNA polymerase sigma factor [Kribbella sp. VKM Ac-2568]|uniref:RNA polymerase sigma factor n=1 Tax=Kribbella sp. VKM Ac-2568 TaxID=2512219 RepID=UPI0010464589|nr:sigma-70 family RNA polymerase sigma factor [Kribbella sp. VKM Ac-2568]TCM40417.1 RNA polymerase sigma factor (sigma-70 family) [Kribbella sp. VKM Ac-2568]
MEDDVSPVTALVAAAAGGEQRAWRELVGRYAPLLVSVIRQFRLTPSETEDVAQTVWLRLVEHLDSLQEPRAIPRWIITIARRESIRYLSSARRLRPNDPLDPEYQSVAADTGEPDEGLLRAEQHEVLLAGLAELPRRQRELLLLLLEDPQPSYVEISKSTGIPVGSIGPTRSRALERLRRSPPVRAYVAVSERTEPSGGDRHDATTLG